jgi:hypothetical protein
MFKPKKQPKTDDLSARHHDLPARLVAAEGRLNALRTEAIGVASCNPEKLAGLSESAAKIEFEIGALRAAIEQAERERAEAEEIARREADKRARQQTAHDLRKLAPTLKKRSRRSLTPCEFYGMRSPPPCRLSVQTGLETCLAISPPKSLLP